MSDVVWSYRGFDATFEFDAELGVYGRAWNDGDLVTFQARTVEEAYDEFKTSVDVYYDMTDEGSGAPLD